MKNNELRDSHMHIRPSSPKIRLYVFTAVTGNNYQRLRTLEGLFAPSIRCPYDRFTNTVFYINERLWSPRSYVYNSPQFYVLSLDSRGIQNMSSGRPVSSRYTLFAFKMDSRWKPLNNFLKESICGFVIGISRWK